MNRSGQRHHFWVNFFAEGRQVDSALKVLPQEGAVSWKKNLLLIINDNVVSSISYYILPSNFDNE